MPMELRRTGIDLLDNIRWGTHFCHFYETKQDLLDIVVPYFKVGLEDNEFCLWVISDPLSAEEASSGLRQAVPELNRYLTEGSIEILRYPEWYLKSGAFDLHKVMRGWKKKLAEALGRGYEGIRVSGNTAWIQKNDWKNFSEYEEQVGAALADQHTIVLCTYPVAVAGATEILDVARTHQFAIAKRHGNWEVFESSELKQTKEEIERLNKELEKRVIERTRELAATNEALRREMTERKEAEDDLRSQKEILQKIFDHIPVLIAFWDQNGRLKLVNREWERMLGWSLKEIQEENLDILAQCYSDPQERQEVWAFIAAASGEWADFRPRLRDGRVIDTTWTNVRLADRTSIGIGQDITERKRAEDRLRLVIDTIPAMVASTLPDGSVDSVNQRWLEYTGWSLEEGQGWGWKAMIHPEDLPRIMEEWPAAVATGKPAEIESRVRRVDGEYRWFLHRSVPLRDELGNIVKWYSASTDIEDRKRAEDALRRSESQLAEAQRLARVGSWNWDLRSNIMTWSEELYRIFALHPQKFDPAYETFVMEYIHPEDRDLVRGVHEKSLRTREPFTICYRIIRPEGGVRIMHSSGNVVSDEQGNVIRMFGTEQDVTERRLAEEQLKRSNEKLRALSARVQSVREEESFRIAREIHDELGSSLTGLKMDLSWLGKRLPEAGNKVAHQKLKAMSAFIDESMQKIRSITTQLRPSVLDDLGLAAAIEWQAREFQQRIEIACKITSLPQEVALSPEKCTAVFRILQEILTNVARHAGATSIEISLEEHDDTFVLQVSDNGKGIKQSDISDTNSLGLLGMRERAIVFGGRVDITGTEGKGTTVTVSIPRNAG